ncbi:uncharacterized protein LOC143190993 [Rhynchophorus ferrugineus]|uniref:HMG box domain-containing protein n=1 Tax=Rhynchophorus ferrugineus TaxID=354439 RepID=A0A834MG32_RHYFE|nr:hypothetical protein GWI33_008180 [Rhynchophorus ferrugineus]
MVKQRSSSKSKNANNPINNRRDGRGVHKTGRVTKNPFLNFLREMRKRTQGLTPIEITTKGAEIWRSMTKHEKEPYCALAKQAARRGRRRRRKSRRGRRRRRGRSRTRSVSSDSEADCIVEAKRGRRRRSKSRRRRSRRRAWR